MARDLVQSVTGEIYFHGHDPVAMLLAWTFDPETWANQPLIPIRNSELRGELKLSASQTVFSYADLTNHEPLMVLISGLAHIEQGRKLNPLESKVGDINEKLATLERVFDNRALLLIPDAADGLGAWHPIGEPTGNEAVDATSIAGTWAAVKDAFLADDAPAFAVACDRLIPALNSLPAAYRPSALRIDTELHYNRLRPFRTAWIVMLVGAVLAGLAMLVRQRWFDVVAVLGLVAGFGLLTYGLSLRWHIAGRIPAANMYESLLFISWGMGAFAILSMLIVRHRVVPLTASAMGALALILAEQVLPGSDHYIRPIPPVLQDTIWMTIHVPVVMVSYSVLALAVLIAHVQLIAMAIAPQNRRLATAIDTMHYWYVLVGSLLLLAGIVTGSMWGASSWGRYWGWDPKEVWSLVAFLGYMVILHVRVDRERASPLVYPVAAAIVTALFVIVVPKLAPLTAGEVIGLIGAAGATVFFVLVRGRFATAVKSILAFWLIIMTYVGVNYVLGIGLHSYGFGTGAAVYYMFLLGGVDLGLVAVCAIIYLARRNAGVGFPPGTPAASLG